MKGPETRLRKKIQEALQKKYPEALFLKIHGGPMQNVGIPDLLCCVKGMFIGLEIKRPGKKPTPAQAIMFNTIRQAGGWADYATSVDEALGVTEEALSRRRQEAK